jgi:hypothetical protein
MTEVGPWTSQQSCPVVQQDVPQHVVPRRHATLLQGGVWHVLPLQ